MYTQQGTCGSSVLLLLIVYLLHFPCGQCPPRPQLLVGAVGTTGKLGTLLGLEGGSRLPAPTLAVSTRNASSPACQFLPHPPHLCLSSVLHFQPCICI